VNVRWLSGKWWVYTRCCWFSSFFYEIEKVHVFSAEMFIFIFIKFVWESKTTFLNSRPEVLIYSLFKGLAYSKTDELGCIAKLSWSQSIWLFSFTPRLLWSLSALIKDILMGFLRQGWSSSNVISCPFGKKMLNRKIRSLCPLNNSFTLAMTLGASIL